eukprot:5545222-Prymnesium_polylepis.1
MPRSPSSSLRTPRLSTARTRSPALSRRCAQYGPYVSKGPGYTNARVLPVSIVPESETDGVTVKTVHVQYDFKHADGNFRCYRRVVMTADGWKSDRELFPLDSPKAYAKLMPKRDAFGHLYMQLG